MEIPKRGKVLKSAYESPTFDINLSIHVDRTVGSASISPCSRDVVLASTDGLDIIDLDSPLSPPRHLRNGSRWLVADVQWSPFAARDYWVVSTANQNVLVWNLNKQEDANGCIEHTLTAHQRAITDINFSAHHPDILATCAVDGYVHLWDLRRPHKPANTFTDWFSGATQVKCNRQNQHIFASSHDRWLRIWDDRNSAVPLRSINAHASKIYGLDWNRTRETAIVTCSLDKTIKFWDYSDNIEKEENIIKTGFPVWRARHTPFGFGLLAMSQDAPGNLYLYDRRPVDKATKHSDLVKIFPGYGNVKIKEFLWRSRGGITDDGIDNRDFQLVSWGDDNNLRLQTLETSILNNVGYIKGTQKHTKLNVTRVGSVYTTFRVIENTMVTRKAPTITRTPKPMSFESKMNTLTAGVSKKYLSRSPKSKVKDSSLPKPTMRARQTDVGEQKEPNKIDWMSGIKIHKPIYFPLQRRLSKQKSLAHPEDINNDRSWNQPESLHDEIIRIHNQLPKIKFDDVDMEKRMIVASINGPWAEDAGLVHIKLTAIFPEYYPETESPEFNIENTSLISSSTHEKLIKDIQHIAESYSAHGQGCLEKIFRYLVGELDYEASIFLNEIRILDEDNSPLNESSSDDENNFPAGAFVKMLPVSSNANVPLPRLCGAVFSNNGKLVCFFQINDKIKSLLATCVTSNDISSKERPYFDRFGRLQNNPLSFGQKGRSLNIAFEGRSDSEFSDESEISNSSDFSVQNDRPPLTTNLDDSICGTFKYGPAPSDSHLSNGAITGTGTSTCIESWVIKPRSKLVLYSIERFLPSKIELARDYIVFGDISKVCEHNATVSEHHGFQELADLWRIVAIILCDDPSLKEFCNDASRNDMSILRQDSSIKDIDNLVKQNQSRNELSYSTWSASFLCRMRWGTHPLAGQFIRDIFTYFEQRADIQMLAMLSCIFSEPPTKTSAEFGSLIKSLRSSSPVKEPITIDFPPLNMIRSSDKSFLVTPKNYDPLKTMKGAWTIVPASKSHSFNETSSLPTVSSSLERKNRKSQSLSASPERLGASVRVNSIGLASSLAASFYRLASSSTSPPKNQLGRKRASPVDHVQSSLTPNSVTWGNTTILGSLKEHEGSDYKTLDCSTGNNSSSQLFGIKLVPQNKHLFEDEALQYFPLIDTSTAPLNNHYRTTYASMLYAWNAPISRLEILKYNDLLASKSELRSTPAPTTTSVLKNSLSSNHNHQPFKKNHSNKKNMKNKNFRPKTSSNSNEGGQYESEEEMHGTKNKNIGEQNTIIVGNDKNQSLEKLEGLDITGFCIKHEFRLEPVSENIPGVGGAVGRCKRCKTYQRQLRCIICLEPVSAIFCPCLSCGCVSHLDCLTNYHSQGYSQCPGGCNCKCTIKAGMGMVESWEVMMGSLLEQFRMEDNGKEEEEETMF
ncbi:putative RWD, RING finger and WD repeat-containing protein C11E3.05 [Erysiphe neolycopersici]|uniref:Putative RWD, RING finger and WD repeat-containing protein C11E3.05 n=1 Tax=Erysiphe neolycopersici TaxID=212602 RepID=A0A420HZP9_9PEZI|nr:putative RWD, RING finger and WD repeat-containing protein C11E3.05 [Erysiphe neolycopersici]